MTLAFLLGAVSSVEFWTGVIVTSIIFALGIYAHYKYR